MWLPDYILTGKVRSEVAYARVRACGTCYVTKDDYDKIRGLVH